MEMLCPKRKAIATKTPPTLTQPSTPVVGGRPWRQKPSQRAPNCLAAPAFNPAPRGRQSPDPVRQVSANARCTHTPHHSPPAQGHLLGHRASIIISGCRGPRSACGKKPGPPGTHPACRRCSAEAEEEEGLGERGEQGAVRTRPWRSLRGCPGGHTHGGGVGRDESFTAGAGPHRRHDTARRVVGVRRVCRHVGVGVACGGLWPDPPTRRACWVKVWQVSGLGGKGPPARAPLGPPPSSLAATQGRVHSLSRDSRVPSLVRELPRGKPCRPRDQTTPSP